MLCPKCLARRNRLWASPGASRRADVDRLTPLGVRPSRDAPRAPTAPRVELCDRGVRPVPGGGCSGTIRSSSWLRLMKSYARRWLGFDGSQVTLVLVGWLWQGHSFSESVHGSGADGAIREHSLTPGNFRIKCLAGCPPIRKSPLPASRQAVTSLLVITENPAACNERTGFVYLPCLRTVYSPGPSVGKGAVVLVIAHGVARRHGPPPPNCLTAVLRVLWDGSPCWVFI